MCVVDMEVWGLEPQTYGLQSHRSSHLSYTPGNRYNRVHAINQPRTVSTAADQPQRCLDL